MFLYFSYLEVEFGRDLDQICFHVASLAGSGPTFFLLGGHCVLNLAPWGALQQKKAKIVHFGGSPKWYIFGVLIWDPSRDPS